MIRISIQTMEGLGMLIYVAMKSAESIFYIDAMLNIVYFILKYLDSVVFLLGVTAYFLTKEYPLFLVFSLFWWYHNI